MRLSSEGFLPSCYFFIHAARLERSVSYAAWTAYYQIVMILSESTLIAQLLAVSSMKHESYQFPMKVFADFAKARARGREKNEVTSSRFF
jgi:hypothetical protein